MKKTLLIPMLALFASSTTFANSLVYGGASAGSSEYLNDKSVSYSLYVGTGVIPFLGIEGGYTDFGKFDAAGGDIQAEAAYGALRPNVTFGPLQIYAKLGVNSWVLEGDAGVNIEDDDGVDEMWAVGADYAMFGPMALGIEYSNYSFGNKDVKSINATATFYFF
ncbi:porin family protein [Vibrio sp.]|uniref:Porin family protein n=1 Tax=Vibrio viridaestus TaxID=2487322 RepID=A0A3N9TJH2_9VIBR|nr:outer membrane beta-barrel protein [Vibrio viridaestus]MDC0610362.1 porin family protein [Vibrio sp.]RQW64311.1 porin family protein [Vibrio viridaestus]